MTMDRSTINEFSTNTLLSLTLNINPQVSKNIFNKNDSNVGLLRTVKKVWIQEEHNKQ